MRCVRATIVAVKKQYIFCVCVCILSYPAHNAHAPYFHPWPVRLRNIFPRSHKRQDILKKMFLNKKKVS